MAIAPAALVDGPIRQPLPHGLFSVFSFRPEGDGRWQNGVTYENGTFEPAKGVAIFDCEDPDQNEIDLEGAAGPLGEGLPFVVYGNFKCSPVGYSESTARDRAVSHLFNREEARVEQALWTGDLGNQPVLASSETDTVAGGAAVSAAAGIGALEVYIAETYGSLGVMHMTRATATVLLSQDVLKVGSGGTLRTVLGTPVVTGAGYPGTGPSGGDPAKGEAWVYATPALYGYRSEVFTPSLAAGDTFDTGQNDLYAVAERTYLIGFDPSGVGAALLTLATGGGGMGTPGKSAYDIAVEDGFEGTEPEWIESLKGDKGAKGDTGARGTAGTKGDTGTPGTNGTDGDKGAKGDKGDTGSAGTNGTDGEDGVVQSIIGGTGVTVDDTDPANPTINADGV